MGRSIVTGKGILDFRFWILDFHARNSEMTTSTPIENPKSKIQNARGFSLLELMIAMFIMIILLSLAVPTFQRSVRQAREVVLKENLFQIRRSIDQFQADKGKLPSSVSDLVEAKYLREAPVDPISEKTDWNEVMGEDTNSPDGEQGMIDVKTLAQGEDSDGKSFSEY